MSNPIELRVGIDQWHTSVQADEVTQLYLAARALPLSGAEDMSLLVIDREFIPTLIQQNVPLGEAGALLRDIGERCRRTEGCRYMPEPSVTFRSALARAAGVLVATMKSYTNIKGDRVIPAYPVERFILDSQNNWRTVSLGRDDQERPHGAVELYVPVNPLALPEIMREQCVPRQ